MAEVFNLAAAATTLLERVAAAPAGRAALTVVADAALRCADAAGASGACSWPTTTPVGGDAPGPVGPRAAGDEQSKLGRGSGRPPADPVDPAPVESLEDAGVLLRVAATPSS